MFIDVSLGRRIFPSLAAALCCLLLPAFASAADEPEIPEPEDITLVTGDFLSLKCTWYAGTQGKKTVPVILIHGWDGQRTELEQLALDLQARGVAVLVPDLRGHGASLRVKQPGVPEKELDRKLFKPADFSLIVEQDLDACKKFLVEKNNKEELNIELLTLVGVDFGGQLAMAYTAYDWGRPQLPAFKLGQDVKALVLISPTWSHKGVTAQLALTNEAVSKRVSLMFIYGAKDARATADAKRMHNQVKRFHPIPADKDEQKKKQDLFLIELDTSLTGAKIAQEKGLAVDARIASFIGLRLIPKQEDLPWAIRRSPTGD